MNSDLYNAALAILARRDHSQRELAQKLRARLSFSSVELNILFEALSSLGYLNDKRFAEAYTRARIRKGFGPERIKLELLEKGVEEEFINDVISSDDILWSDLAQQVWQKKYHNSPHDLKEKAKQVNFLRYRGFRIDQFEKVFDLNH